MFRELALRPRKYGGGGHASFAGRDFPPAPVCTPLKQNGGIAAKRIAYIDSLGSEHAAVYCSTPWGLNIRLGCYISVWLVNYKLLVKTPKHRRATVQSHTPYPPYVSSPMTVHNSGRALSARHTRLPHQCPAPICSRIRVRLRVADQATLWPTIRSNCRCHLRMHEGKPRDTVIIKGKF